MCERKICEYCGNDMKKYATYYDGCHTYWACPVPIGHHGCKSVPISDEPFMLSAEELESQGFEIV